MKHKDNGKWEEWRSVEGAILDELCTGPAPPPFFVYCWCPSPAAYQYLQVVRTACGLYRAIFGVHQKDWARVTCTACVKSKIFQESFPDREGGIRSPPFG